MAPCPQLLAAAALLFGYMLLRGSPGGEDLRLGESSKQRAEGGKRGHRCARVEDAIAGMFNRASRLNTKFRMCGRRAEPTHGTAPHNAVREPAPPVASLSIVSTFQIITQLGSVFAIPYPPVYKRALRWLSVVNFDLVKLAPFECLLPYNFYVSLLSHTILPMVSVALLLLARGALGGCPCPMAHGLPLAPPARPFEFRRQSPGSTSIHQYIRYSST